MGNAPKKEDVEDALSGLKIATGLDFTFENETLSAQSPTMDELQLAIRRAFHVLDRQNINMARNDLQTWRLQVSHIDSAAMDSILRLLRPITAVERQLFKLTGRHFILDADGNLAASIKGITAEEEMRLRGKLVSAGIKAHFTSLPGGDERWNLAIALDPAQESLVGASTVARIKGGRLQNSAPISRSRN